MSIARRFTSFTQREIRQTFKSAKRVLKEPELTVLLAPATLPHGRLLVVAARAVGTAPRRNKVRRRIKSIFYQQKFFERGFDCIVLVRTAATEVSFERLESLLLQAFAAADSPQNGSQPDIRQPVS
jgi:ribonuclease P protein component